MNYSSPSIVHIFISLFLIISSGACTSTGQHSPIDDLHTVKDIEGFVHQLGPQYKHFTVNQSLYFEHPNCRQIVQSLQIKPWMKSDVDGNGYQDLIIHSRWQQTNYLVTLMVFPKEVYRLKIMDDGGCNCARIIKTHPQSLIHFFNFNQTLYQKTWSEMVSFSHQFHHLPTQLRNQYQDTLTYKFGDIIEYNPSFKALEIDSLHFKTMRCFGHCPIFEMSISEDGSATYRAIQDVLRKGRFQAKIDRKQFQNIKSLLSYIQVDRLNNRYQQEGLVDPATVLTIVFKNGVKKTITDTNYQGTRGLGRLYDLLIDLRKTQQWKKIE